MNETMSPVALNPKSPQQKIQVNPWKISVFLFLATTSRCFRRLFNLKPKIGKKSGVPKWNPASFS
jgi:hypothetical protein